MKTRQTNISEVRLVYRTKVKASERLKVKCLKNAFDIFMESWDLDSIEHIEEFKLMLQRAQQMKFLGELAIKRQGYNSTDGDKSFWDSVAFRLCSYL